MLLLLSIVLYPQHG